MNTSKVLIIGCGYVGTALAERLVTAGSACVGTTTTPARLNEIKSTGARAEILDIGDRSALRAILSDCETVVLSIAPKSRDADYRDVYLAAANHLMAAVADSPVRHVVYTSSTRVYAQDDGQWVDEDSSTEPTSEAGRVLLDTERCLLDAGSSSEINVSVVRLGGIYGPGRDPSARILRLAGSSCSGGSAYVNLIHRDDIVEALHRLIQSEHHGPLNLCDDTPTTRRDYYDRVIAAASVAPIEWEAEESDERGKRVSNARIKELLDLTLRHPAH